MVFSNSKSPPIQKCTFDQGCEASHFSMKLSSVLTKKWGILIKKESESLEFTGLKFYANRDIFPIYVSAVSKNNNRVLSLASSGGEKTTTAIYEIKYFLENLFQLPTIINHLCGKNE